MEKTDDMAALESALRSPTASGPHRGPDELHRRRAQGDALKSAGPSGPGY